MKTYFLNFLKRDVLCIGIAALLIVIYFYPFLSGKSLAQHDIVQTIATYKEARDYKAAGESEVLWSNSSFGGMPVWEGFNTSITTNFHRLLTKAIPNPIIICLYAFIGFYILMQVLGSNRWVAFIAGLAFTFATFNIVSIQAGHINKVLGISLMAPVLAGIILTYRKKYWSGIALTTIATALHINYAHVQITYYLLFIIGGLGIIELVRHIRAKELKHFFIASAILILCAFVALLPNISRLWTMEEYAKSTPRGGSALNVKAKEGNGLEWDYVFQWSNGVFEPITVFIPGFYGGSNNEPLGKNSALVKALRQNDQLEQAKVVMTEGAGLYWGNQPGTSGPVYFGAIVCFLFVLALFMIKEPWKWVVFALCVLSFLWSMGKNFQAFNDFFFYNVPMYNKFRSVTMALSIAQLLFPLLGFYILARIIDEKENKEDIIRGLKWSVIILGGFALLMSIIGSGLFTFMSEREIAALAEDAKQKYYFDILVEDRISLFRFDAFKAFALVAITAGLIWAYINKKIQAPVLYGVLSLLIVFDFWIVDKKYLSKDDFTNQKNIEKETFVASAADEYILKDSTKSYRVLDLTTGNPFSDAMASYYHKSLGGYSAIKLGRYQEVIDSCLGRGVGALQQYGVQALPAVPEFVSAINMFNTKYLIMFDSTGRKLPRRNPNALGNAWFIESIKVYNTADEELVAIQSFNPAGTATTTKEFDGYLKGFDPVKDSSGTIKLVTYHPNRLEYESNSASEQFAVFSEIYYQPGWNAYIDNNPAEHIRVNYILRGMKIPAGKHKVEFRFEPEYYYTGEKISYAGSVIFVLLLAACGFFGLKNLAKKESGIE